MTTYTGTLSLLGRETAISARQEAWLRALFVTPPRRDRRNRPPKKCARCH